MAFAEWFVSAITWYLTAGGVVAVAFLIFGIERVDHNASGSLAFRPLLVPGLCLIWPLVIWRWYSIETSKQVEK